MKKKQKQKKHTLLNFNNNSIMKRTQDFKICKLAKWWRHKLDQILIKFHEKDISANSYQKSLILDGKILLEVLHNMS